MKQNMVRQGGVGSIHKSGRLSDDRNKIIGLLVSTKDFTNKFLHRRLIFKSPRTMQFLLRKISLF